MTIKRPRLSAYDKSHLTDGSPAIVGVDEAGRGALAGPVVAGAVYFSRGFYNSKPQTKLRPLVRDSKQISTEQREKVFGLIERFRNEGHLWFSAGIASVEEIEEWNILGATRLAMKRAIDEALAAAGCPEACWRASEPGDFFSTPEQMELIARRPLIMVDGRPLRPFFYPHAAIVQGDSLSFAIAAASIVAKITRDRLMREHHAAFAHYGFDANKGYGTPRHIAALSRHGACRLHREKFLARLLTSIADENTAELDFEGKAGDMCPLGMPFSQSDSSGPF